MPSASSARTWEGIDRVAVREWLRRLYFPGDVFEVRASVGSRTWAGCYHYSDLERVEDEVLALAEQEPSITFTSTLNPVGPHVLSRGPLTESSAKALDADVRERRWLLIEVNGVGQDAADAADRTVADLTNDGWPAPVRLMAGPVTWLLYRVRLQNNREDQALLSRLTASVNAAQTVPLVGSHRGDHAVVLVSSPARLELVTREQLGASTSTHVSEALTSPPQPTAAPSVATAALQVVATRSDPNFERGLENLEAAFATMAPVAPLVFSDDITFAPQQAPVAPPPVARPVPPAPIELPPLAPLPVVTRRQRVEPVVAPTVIPDAELPRIDFGDALERYRGLHQQAVADMLTGVPALDEATAGLQGLVVLEAASGLGKSTLGLRMALSVAGATGGPVACVVSATMDHAAITDRLVSGEAHLPLDVLRYGRRPLKTDGRDGLRLDADERARLTEAIATLNARSARLVVVDQTWVQKQAREQSLRVWLSELILRARRAAGGVRCLCVIDDLEGLDALTGGDNQAAIVAELSQVATANPDDVFLLLTSGEGGKKVTAGIRTRLKLTKPEASGDDPAGEHVDLAVYAGRKLKPHTVIPLRFHYREHRFEARD
jgi:hypothetical protein